MPVVKPKSKQEPKYFTVREVAKMLGISPQVLGNMIYNNRVVPTVKGVQGKNAGHKFSPELVARIKDYMARWKSIKNEVIK